VRPAGNDVVRGATLRVQSVRRDHRTGELHGPPGTKADRPQWNACLGEREMTWARRTRREDDISGIWPTPGDSRPQTRERCYPPPKHR
jgi:hypothetical protein